MSPLVAATHDPWMGLCLALALGDRLDSVVTYGGIGWAERFAAAGVRATLADPVDEATSIGLLEDARISDVLRGRAARLLVFKPSRRLEDAADALGASLAHPSASVAQGLENKLTLRALASEAGIPVGLGTGIGVPAQRGLRVSDETTFESLCAAVGASRLVIQSPRGFMGKRTWGVGGQPEWDAERARFEGRQLKVTAWVAGRPGTLNAVVDREGAVLCTAPIVQVTGEPSLTPFPMGSCGNDFTWRPAPHPGGGPARLAAALGPVLAQRGFTGHFGIDFVVDSTPEGPHTWLIEINPRLTASMALYSAWRPVLAHAHVDALEGRALPATGELPPLQGGQIISHNVGAVLQAPLRNDEAGCPTGGSSLPVDAPRLWSQETTHVEPGATRGRIVTPGAVIDHAGDLVLRLA